MVSSESDAKKMSESLDIKKTVGIKVVFRLQLQVVTAAIDNIWTAAIGPYSNIANVLI